MKKGPFVSGLELTQAERERDRKEKLEALEREGARRKARRSGQRYDKLGSPGHRKNYARMVGSE